jgi:hypothetical protein
MIMIRVWLTSRWCGANKEFLQSPPHPSSLPFYLHRTIFSNLPAKEAILYARQYLMPFMPTHQVLPLLTSALYQDRQIPISPLGPQPIEGGSLVSLFREEFCRRHGWPKEDPLEVIVDLGSRGGALNAVEKARKLIGERLGQDARTWDELPVCHFPPFFPSSLLPFFPSSLLPFFPSSLFPSHETLSSSPRTSIIMSANMQMEIPLPASRRYHSVFVCPVSKEQATETNPPKMLSCGHTIASESLKRMIKPGCVRFCSRRRIN